MSGTCENAAAPAELSERFVELKPAHPSKSSGPPRHWAPYLYISVLHSLTVFVLATLAPAQHTALHCDPQLTSGWTVLMGPVACLLPIDRCEPWQHLFFTTSIVIVGTVLFCHAWVLRWTGWGVAVSMTGWLVGLSWGCMASVLGI